MHVTSFINHEVPTSFITRRPVTGVGVGCSHSCSCPPPPPLPRFVPIRHHTVHCAIHRDQRTSTLGSKASVAPTSLAVKAVFFVYAMSICCSRCTDRGAKRVAAGLRASPRRSFRQLGAVGRNRKPWPPGQFLANPELTPGRFYFGRPRLKLPSVAPLPLSPLKLPSKPRPLKPSRRPSPEAEKKTVRLVILRKIEPIS